MNFKIENKLKEFYKANENISLNCFYKLYDCVNFVFENILNKYIHIINKNISYYEYIY